MFDDLALEWFSGKQFNEFPSCLHPSFLNGVEHNTSAKLSHCIRRDSSSIFTNSYWPTARFFLSIETLTKNTIISYCDLADAQGSKTHKTTTQ